MVSVCHPAHDMKLESLMRTTSFAAMTTLRHAFLRMKRGVVFNVERFSPLDTMLASGMLAHGLSVLKVKPTIWAWNSWDICRDRRKSEVVSVDKDGEVPLAVVPMLHGGSQRRSMSGLEP